MTYFTGTLLASPIVRGSSGDTYGTHYSVLGVGGYMEVETISQRDLLPVDSIKGLDYDGLSSGQRRLGMLVKVLKTDSIFELKVDYSTWTGYTNTQKVNALDNNNNWELANLGNGTGDRIEKEFTQTTHGFVPGDVVGWNDIGGEYELISSVTGSTIEPLGVIYEIPDSNKFKLCYAGYIEDSSLLRDENNNPLLANKVYYLSTINAGKLSLNDADTIGEISKPMLSTLTNVDALVFQYRGATITEEPDTSSASGERNTKDIYQITHGFIVGDVVGYDTDKYIKTKATDEYFDITVGIVTNVISQDWFTVTYEGYTDEFTGLITNTVYYLSDTILGGLRTTPPTIIGNFVKPMIIAISATEAIVFSHRGDRNSIVNNPINGLSRAGISNKDVKLGGDLCENTIVSGIDTYSLDYTNFNNISLSTSSGNLVIDAQNNSELVLKSQSGVVGGDIFTDSVGFDLNYNENTFLIIDNRVGVEQRGIEYIGNYSTNYTKRSLVDKEYVDTLATGIDPKDAVQLATTESDGNIDLTGGTFTSGSTIDNIVLQDSWRVVIKNQTNAVENGIYQYSGTSDTFYRASDFDGDPEGEVSQGAYSFVITGDTNGNTSWIVRSLDPIVVDTDEIIWGLFSKFSQISSGDGININSVGGKEEISVYLALNSGLEFASSGLRLATTTAGSGLTYTDGVLNVNATVVVATGNEVDVKINPSNDLYIDTSDLMTCLDLSNYITSGTNGLSKIGQSLMLGGILTGDTIVNTNDYSIAFGKDTCATGCNSFTIGTCSYATGCNSFAGGYAQGGAYLFAAGDSSFVFGGGDNEAHVAYGDYSVLLGGAGNINSSDCSAIIGGHANVLNSGNNRSVILGGDTIVVSGSSLPDYTITPNLAIWNAPVSGDLNDDILVWNSTDRRVKKIPTSEFADNIYDNVVISANTTLDSTNYVTLVNNSGSTTITLPSSPTNGLAYKIKDVYGNAVNNNITISGNGKNIDGGSDVIINTNYGAIELIYNSLLDEWFVLSFVI